jgi:hypothetical protein
MTVQPRHTELHGKSPAHGAGLQSDFGQAGLARRARSSFGPIRRWRSASGGCRIGWNILTGGDGVIAGGIHQKNDCDHSDYRRDQHTPERVRTLASAVIVSTVHCWISFID